MPSTRWMPYSRGWMALFSGMDGYLDASIAAMNDADTEMADDWY